MGDVADSPFAARTGPRIGVRTGLWRRLAGGRTLRSEEAIRRMGSPAGTGFELTSLRSQPFRRLPGLRSRVWHCTSPAASAHPSTKVRLFGQPVSAIVKEIGPQMKKKPHSKSEPVVPPQILEQAKRAVSVDRIRQVAKCSVCGAETADAGSEPLCWVCRRLKISAWRDIEQQAPMQE